MPTAHVIPAGRPHVTPPAVVLVGARVPANDFLRGDGTGEPLSQSRSTFPGLLGAWIRAAGE
jgi:hypothetical protein